jgi:hypothetical protein
MPQISDMGPIILLPFRRKACWGILLPFKTDTTCNLNRRSTPHTPHPPKKNYAERQSKRKVKLKPESHMAVSVPLRASGCLFLLVGIGVLWEIVCSFYKIEEIATWRKLLGRWRSRMQYHHNSHIHRREKYKTHKITVHLLPHLTIRTKERTENKKNPTKN